MNCKQRDIIQLNTIVNEDGSLDYWPPSYEYNQFAGYSSSDIKIEISPEFVEHEETPRESVGAQLWTKYIKSSYLRHLIDMESSPLKTMFCIHFVLTVWATLSKNYLPDSYFFMHLVILGFAAYAILYPDHSESVQMFMVLLAGSIILDIIFIGVYQPLSHAAVETDLIPVAIKNSYRFSLGMSIVNLLFKPFSVFMLYRIFQERGGSYGDLGIPGIPQFPGGTSGNYENIDSPPSHGIETATPHSGMEKDFMASH